MGKNLGENLSFAISFLGKWFARFIWEAFSSGSQAKIQLQLVKYLAGAYRKEKTSAPASWQPTQVFAERDSLKENAKLIKVE